MMLRIPKLHHMQYLALYFVSTGKETSREGLFKTISLYKEMTKSEFTELMLGLVRRGFISEISTDDIKHYWQITPKGREAAAKIAQFYHDHPIP